LKASGDGDLATSPKATSATADDDIFRAGDTVTCTVDLDPSTTDYPFFDYNVDHVKIYRKNDFGEPDEIKDVSANNDQTKFVIPWVADADGSINTEDYYAFVTTDALPVPGIGELELQKFSVPAEVAFTSRNSHIYTSNRISFSRTGLTVIPIGSCDPGSDTDARELDYREDASKEAADTTWIKSGKVCGAIWTKSGDDVGNSRATVESFQYTETLDSDGKLRISGSFKADAMSDSGEQVTGYARAAYEFRGKPSVPVNVHLMGTYDVLEMTGSSRVEIQVFVGTQCNDLDPSTIGVCGQLTASGSYDGTRLIPADGGIHIFAKFDVYAISESVSPSAVAGKFDFTMTVTPASGNP
jgi:hypothetical protein